MTWNHRVTRRTVQNPPSIEAALTDPGATEYAYEIREVYYSDDGRVMGWSEQPTAPYGESWGELVATLGRMLSCSRNPVLDIDSYPAIELSPVDIR